MACFRPERPGTYRFVPLPEGSGRAASIQLIAGRERVSRQVGAPGGQAFCLTALLLGLQARRDEHRRLQRHC